MTIIEEMIQKEEFNFNEIIATIEELRKGLDPIISLDDILFEVQEKNKNNKNTDQLINLIIDIAMSKSTLHPDYSILASRILVSTLHKNTKASFVEKMEDLYNDIDSQLIITEEELQIIQQHKNRLEDVIDYDRDYNYDVFGIKEFEDIFLAKVNNQLVERPQDFLMRIAIGIHKENIDEVIKTYNYMSEGSYLHFPSYFSKNERKQLCPIPSCSIEFKDENISTLFNQLNDCTQIAQSTGEIGVAIHEVPSKVFTSTLHLFNETVSYLNQKQEVENRPFTMYLEPWHADVFDFLTLNNEHNNLNCALWIPDLFMERVENNDDWTLMCPKECPGLSDTYGEEFEMLYKRYEEEGKGRSTINAQELWFKILETQIEIGSLRLLFKDQINKESSQSQDSIIKAPGYSEIKPQHNSKDAIANTGFVSISLPKFVNNKGFDFEKLHDVTYRITVESNSILEQKQIQNKDLGAHNIPIHIEVQGLADSYLKLKIPFHSEEAKQINKEIFEIIQYAVTSASDELTKEKAFGFYTPYIITCNSTFETSRILGNSEGFSPLSSYIKANRWSSESTIVVNEYLLKDLIAEGLWSQSLLQKIIQHQGSIQHIIEIPEHIREVYKTAWEVPQKSIVDRVSDSESFGIQSQSMEVFITNPNFNKLTSIYFYSWKKGLNTSISHLRTKIDSETMEFSINKDISFNILEMNEV